MRYRRGSSGGTKLRSIGIAFVIAALAATLLAAPAGAQAGATCDGEAATIVGSDGDDVLTGTDGADVIAGLGGNDRIDGLEGDDLICGDEGNDTIRAGRGEDTVLGGDGNDVIRGQQNADVIDGGEGNDTIRGNNGADTIWGRNGNDTLLGGKGQDEIRGGTGFDDIGGGNHDDTVFGGADDDVLRGGNAADFIDGGAGIDSIRGGIGVDQIFSGGTSGDEINTGDGNDFIDGVPEGEIPQSIGGFLHTDFSGDTWTGEVYGLVETGVADFVDEQGSCYLLLGELTPETVSEGPISDFTATPGVGVIAGGEFVQDTIISCDHEDAEQRGFSWILDAEAIAGTNIPFYAEIFVPADQGDITEIVIGNPNFQTAVLFPAVMLDETPTPAGLTVGPLPNVDPIGPNADFEFTNFNDATWTGEVSDIVSAPVENFVDDTGRCVLVLGSLTPTATGGGGPVSSGFDAPTISLLVGGRVIDPSSSCDTGAVEDQGFGWILDAEVTVGTEYAFYAEVFIPAALDGAVSHVVVGRPNDNPTLFTDGPDVTPVAPAPEPAPAPAPVPEPAPAPEPAPVAPAVPLGSCHEAYTPCIPDVDDLNCSDLTYQVRLTGVDDPYDLDTDGDGIGCESLPVL